MIPTTLGEFTGQLGTPLSFLGNIELAVSGPVVKPPVVVILSWSSAVTPILTWAQVVAEEQNWKMFLGEDVTATVNPEVPGGPITTWTLALNIANGAGVVVITKTPTIADGPNGIFTFNIAHADTGALGVGQYNYDVSRTDSGSDTVLLTGTITMSKRGGGGT